MVIEKLINVKKPLCFSYPLSSSHGKQYGHLPGSNTFWYTKVYYYDDAKFLIGRVDNRIVMLEVSTCSFAVMPQENIRSICDCITRFKDKLNRTGVSVHEVIARYKLNNLDIEAWKINFMII